MHGVTARRRVAHFGRSYEFDTFKLGEAPVIPDFLLPLRDRAAVLAGCEAEEFAEALVSEYPPGAGIGWHRDAPPFDLIVGVSLLAECTMKFRPWPAIAKKETRAGTNRVKPIARVLAPRSVYILQGEARTKWQHHIPPMTHLRYSITFRTLRRK
jgi:alkylated DNA repair dioxygenase AlkB